MIRIWQLAPGPRQFAVVAAVHDPTAGNFASVAGTADGRGLVTGDRRGHVVAWDLDPAVDAWDDATVAEFAALPYKAQPGWCLEHPDLVRPPRRWTDTRKGWMWNVRVSPDGTAVAAAGEDRGVVVYDVATGAVRYRAESGSRTDFHGLDWRPDGALLAAGGEDDSIYVFDGATGAVHDRLEGSGDVVSAVAWSPDGTTLASTAGGARVSLALLESTTGPDLAIRFWVAR
jgi:WD40 repeat protein